MPVKPIDFVLARERVVVRHKNRSRLMRFLSFFLGYHFLTRAWTTVGPRTIWAPSHVRLDHLDAYESILRHELVHVRQVRRWFVLWHLSYLLLPLPVLLAWFRWRWEREAFLVNLRAGDMGVDDIVDSLWHGYGWCWPRPLMRRWFLKETTR